MPNQCRGCNAEPNTSITDGMAGTLNPSARRTWLTRRARSSHQQSGQHSAVDGVQGTTEHHELQRCLPR